MDFRLLGPLEVVNLERALPIGGPKQRAVLAQLLLRANRLVSVDRLIDSVWGETPPETARNTIQTYVRHLRKTLGAARVQHRANGYLLVAASAEIDAHRFTALLVLARAATDPAVAADTYRDALALWRGGALDDLQDFPAVRQEAGRFEALRAAALEERIGADLDLGRQAALVPELEALVAEHPLRERLQAQLMTALYRSGRQADALAAYRRVSALLRDELGLNPSPELQLLHARILRQDGTLDLVRRPLPAELNPAGRPFVGRVADLDWLRHQWSEVAALGVGRLVAIAGPAGSGRTRLLREFAATMHADGVAVHAGTATSGVAILDDLEDADLPLLTEVGPLLYVASYDPVRANPRVRRAIMESAGAVRELEPLSRAEVAQVVVRIAGTVDAAVVDEIAAAADGWPGAVERLTVELIGRASTRRVAVAVEQAAPASLALAAARSEVATGVRDLARLRAWRSAAAAQATQHACPYRGLAAYEQRDAALFHGRDELVAALCARLVDTVFVAVVGPSGAGKSSLVRAGLLPALADGVLPQFRDVPQWTIVPGTPLPAIDGPGVLVVDQFEEVFTSEVDGGYVDDLVALTQQEDVRVIVVLRGDFVGACAAYPQLARLVGDGTVLVGPMRAEELRHAVELPARQVGLRVEEGLTEVIVDDVRDKPGALPLLSTALVEVWQRRAGATLTAAAYHQAGGVSGAVARLGEAAYASLDEPAQEAARRLLLRLAESDEHGTVVRRRVPRAEFGDDPATVRALDVFVARRLITTSERGVEVTHEAALTLWPRLAGWLAEDERGRALRRHLAPTALDWANAGRPDSELYRGARLSGALDWAGDLSEVERAFLSASRDAADRELREEIARADRLARGRSRLRAALAATLALLIVATGAAVVALDRQRAATTAGREALARRLGALALVTPDLDRSLLLAVQAMRTHDEWETRGDLLAVLARSPQALHQARGAADKGSLVQVAMTGDGSTVVAAGGGGGRMFTWSASTLARTAEPDPIAQTARSVIAGPGPHDVFVAAAVNIDTGAQAVLRWDAVERRTLTTYALPQGVKGSSRRLAVTADHRVLAVPTLGRALLLYDVTTGQPRGEMPLPAPPGDVWSVGSLLLTVPLNSEKAYLIDPYGARVVSTMTLPFAGTVTASPDGRALLVTSGERATLISVADGRVIRHFAGATRAAGTATFTADGTMLAVGGGDHLIGVWDVATGDLRDTLRGHAAPVLSLTFAADGRTLYSVGGDNSVIAWDTAGDRSFAARASRAPTVPAAGTSYIGLTTIVWPLVGWSADRKQVYVGVPDGSGTAVIDVAAGVATRTPIPYQLDPAAATPVVDFDRGAIFLTTIDGMLERRDLVSAGLLADSSAQPTPSRFGVAVSGDGRLVATAMTDPQKAHRIDLVDPKTLAVRNTIGPLDHFPFGLWLSADGSLLAAASEGPGHHVELWDTRTGKRRWITDVGVDQGLTFALSPDGRTLLVATLRGEAVALDLATGRIRARYEQQIASRIVSAEYAPDGTVVAVTGDDGQVHLLQAATLREIGTLPMPGADWANVAFQRDGRTMSAVDDRGRVVQWPASPTTWVERACGIVGRDLTRAEWAAYLPGQEYERTCTATTQSPPARP